MDISRAALFPGLDGFARSLGIYHSLFKPAQWGKKSAGKSRWNLSVAPPNPLATFHFDSESASARSSFAPSPRHALPCMHASVVGFVAASRSSIALAFFV